MKEPKRLLSHGASDFERQLLRAVASERPSSLLRSRMQRSLGLVGPLAWASNVKAMFGSASTRVAMGATVAGVIVAGGVTAYQLLPQRDANDTPPVAAIEPAVIEAGLREPVAVPEVTAAPRAAAVEAAAPEASAAAAPSRSPVAEDSEDGRLREEIALLDGVKSALQRGEREQARQSLDTYRERFPEGILRREANVLRRRAEAKSSRNGDGADDSGD